MREIHSINLKKHARLIIIYLYDIYYLNTDIYSKSVIT